MAKLKIFTFPDDVLKQKAQPIGRVDKSLYKLADDMLETMYGAPGIGLAANQVGILDRIIVVDTEFDIEEIPEGGQAPEGVEVVDGGIVKNRKPRIIVNPRIIHKEGEVIFPEACLSVPEYSADVKRAEKIILEYQNVDGLTKKLDAEGLLAVCIQHEIDHLEGKLFIDRLSTMKKELAKKKLLKARKEREEFGEE